jgi:hypothetical protein
MAQWSRDPYPSVTAPGRGPGHLFLVFAQQWLHKRLFRDLVQGQTGRRACFAGFRSSGGVNFSGEASPPSWDSWGRALLSPSRGKGRGLKGQRAKSGYSVARSVARGPEGRSAESARTSLRAGSFCFFPPSSFNRTLRSAEPTYSLWGPSRPSADPPKKLSVMCR